MKQYNFDEIIPRENTNCYKFDLREKFFKTNQVIPMWVADMDFKTPDFVIDGIKKRLEHEILGYSFQGEGLYQSIIRWMQKRHNWTIEKDWIKYTPGVVSALNFAVLAFTKPEEKVIIQPPVYFPFFTCVKDHNRELAENPLKLIKGRYKMDYEHLESIIDDNTKLLILCSPHNPTGNVWSKDELEKLADICIKHNITILSDEIHSDLIMPGYKHIPLASLSEKIAHATLTSMAPSKTFNMAGMASSVLISSNKKLLDKFSSELDKFHLGTGNVLGHYAMEAAYTYGESWLEQLIIYLHKNYKYLSDFIANEIPQIKVINLEATYLVWLDCSQLNLCDGDLHKFMVEKAGLGLSHGPLFGKEGKGFQRINIGCPRKYLETALVNLRDALKCEKLI